MEGSALPMLDPAHRNVRAQEPEWAPKARSSRCAPSELPQPAGAGHGLRGTAGTRRSRTSAGGRAGIALPAVQFPG